MRRMLVVTFVLAAGFASMAITVSTPYFGDPRVVAVIAGLDHFAAAADEGGRQIVVVGGRTG